MKIAYLIVAHHQFNHLQRLIDGLNHDGARFFIHVDLKAAALPELNGPVQFIVQQKVYWAGFSQVEVSLRLMEAARQQGEFDYFILLSGVDYPLKSNQRLLEKLHDERGEYINIMKGYQPTKPAARLEKYHWQKINRRKNTPAVKFMKALEKLVYHLGVRKKVQVQPYVGSNWFALSAECVQYIFEFLKAHPGYKKAFRYALCADESFFHTIIGNSPFIEKCRHCLHYADWSGPNPPATIEEKHLQIFESSKSMVDAYGEFTPFFARKFPDNSGPLVEAIERRLRAQ